MEAILLGQAMIADKDLYDMRHFYFDNERVGHSTCGMAFQTLMDTFREYGVSSRNVAPWNWAISNTPNPIILEYLVAYVCLNTIQRTGWGMLDPELERPLETEIFDSVPDVERLITEGIHTCRLYVLAAFDFPFIDAVIVRLDRNAKKAYIYLVQVAIATNKGSGEDFYRTQWAVWKSSFSSNYSGLSNNYEFFSRFAYINP